MDSLVGLVNQVIPGSPALAILTAVALLAAGWIARKAAASMRRQGVRLGNVEKILKLERTRRRQVEQCLREHRIGLPLWPDDPPELYLAGFRYVDDDRDDRDDDRTLYTTESRAPVPPVPGLPERLSRHRQ